MNRSRLCLLLAVPALAAALAAQEKLPADLATPRTPIHTQAADEGAAYGLWAAGTNYKASFHDGATFVPYLGRDYPRTQSLQWRTVSARIGEQELATAAPRLSHSAFRAEYDLGGIVEAYDVRAEGLEQTFVLRQRPQGPGDLRICGTITTALHAIASAPGHADVTFVDDQGRKILRYGTATAIDSNGRTWPMTTTVTGNALSLDLPGDWLAAAAFPVVVDPLLSVFLSEGGITLADIELAREHALNSGNLWLALSRWASATDADLWLRRYDDDGGNGTTNFTDLTASWSTFEPSLGMHFNSGKGLLAFTREFVTGTRRLRFHLHSRNDNLLQTHVVNFGDNTINAWRADVATDLHPIGQNALVVVYQSEGTGAPFVDLPDSRIHGCAIDLAGNGTAGVPFAIAVNPALDHERPQIGKVQLGSSQVWTVAYQQIDSGIVPSTGQTDWGIALRRVDRLGNVSASTNLNTPGFGFHYTTPKLAGFNSVQMVAYTISMASTVGPHPTGAVGMGVAARRIEWNGTSFSIPSLGEWVNWNNDPRVVITGFDGDRNTGSHYAVTYRSTVSNNVYLGVLGYNGAPVTETTVFTPSGNEFTNSGAVAFDEDGDDFVIAFERTQPGGSSNARLVRFAQPTANPPTLAGIGCSTATLQWQGSQLVGSEHCGVRLDGLAPGALAVVALATQPTAQPLIGVPGVQNGCWLLVPNTGAGHLGFFPLGFGPTATWTLPLPAWLPSMTLYFQGLHFDASNSTVLTTQRLQVPIVK